MPDCHTGEARARWGSSGPDLACLVAQDLCPGDQCCCPRRRRLTRASPLPSRISSSAPMSTPGPIAEPVFGNQPLSPLSAPPAPVASAVPLAPVAVALPVSSTTVKSVWVLAAGTSPEVAPTRVTLWAPSSKSEPTSKVKVTSPDSLAVTASNSNGVEWTVAVTDSSGSNPLPYTSWVTPVPRTILAYLIVATSSPSSPCELAEALAEASVEASAIAAASAAAAALPSAAAEESALVSAELSASAAALAAACAEALASELTSAEASEEASSSAAA